jgi:TM2 domain-containing membrane protein YozV
MFETGDPARRRRALRRRGSARSGGVRHIPLSKHPLREHTMQQHVPSEPVSSRNWLTAVLLSFFLGVVGAHRFYAGKTGTAILMIVTCGGVGVWALIDFIMILVGNFRDAEGLPIKNQS